MPIVTACPKCQTKYQLPEKVLGKTIECKKCAHKFPAVEMGQPVAAAKATAGAAQTAAKTSNSLANSLPSAAAEELAKFGLDGPLKRQPDPLADSPSPPPKDILGNFAADPGFAAVQAAEKVKKNSDQAAGLESIIANPYANQARSTVPITDLSSAPGVGYASLTAAAKITIAALMVAAVSLLVMTGIASYMAYLYWNYVAGLPAPIDQDTLKSLVLVNGIAGIVFLVSIPVYLYAFSMFSFQGYENFRAMGTKELTFSSPMAAFSWLIPLANWVMPALIMAELYRASHKPIGDQWQTKTVSIKIWIWWGLMCAVWIGPLVLALVLGFAQLTSGSLDSFQDALLIRIGTYWGVSLLFLSAIYLFGTLAFEIAANQEKAWPTARKSRQGTGKPAPRSIPYVYSAIALIVTALAMVAVSVILFLRAGSTAEPAMMDNILNYGGGGILAVLAIGSGAIGVIHVIKMFR